MAKFTIPNQNTKFDPVVDQLKSSLDLGLTPISSENKFSLDEQNDRLNSFSNVKASNYGDNVSLLGSDPEAQFALDEQRAQHQSATEQLFKGLGHIGSTLGTEILKTPGYVLGGLGAAVNDKSVIENIVDNDWVNAFENLDTTLKEQMPVYLTKEVQDGNIGKKLMSSAWWATTGADGIGFLLSMYVPGQALKAIGIGAKVGSVLESIAKEAKLSKVLTAANILKRTEAGAQMTAKGIQRIESTAAVAANTYIESASEAANTFDSVKKTYLEQNPNATDEDASKVASTAAANVMKANVGVLMLSNMFDELFLFKGFGRSAEKVAADSTLGKIFKNGVLDVEEVGKLKKLGVKDFLKKAPLKLAENFAKEGLFEEGLQTQIQKHYENLANGKTKASFSEDVLGNYFDNLMNDPEMQESVVLGGILGGGASMFGLASDIKSKNDFMFGKGNSTPSFIGKFLGKKNKEESKGFVNIMNENFINSTRTIHDIADKDENGKPVIDATGKIKVNEEKLKTLVDQKEGLLLLNQLHNLAILEGNKAEENYFGDLLSYNYFLPFLQQEGGYEVLQQHISNQLVEMMAKKEQAATNNEPSQEKKDELKKKLLDKAKEYKKIYDDVDATSNTEMHIPVDNPDVYAGWKGSVRDRKMQALVSYNSAKKGLDEIGLKYPMIDETPDFDKMSPTELIDHRVAQLNKAEYEKRAKEAKDKYVELSDKKGLQEDYKKYNTKVKEDIKATEEAVAEDNKETEKVVAAKSKIDEFNDKAVSLGYDPNEIVTVEDDDANQYQYDPATGIATDKFGRQLKDVSGLHMVSKQKAIKIAEQEQEFQAKQQQVDELQKLAEIKNAYREDIDIEGELADFKTEITKLIQDRIKGKLRLKKQHKLDKELLNKNRKKIAGLITTLTNRITYLESIPNSEKLILSNKLLLSNVTALGELIDSIFKGHDVIQNIIKTNDANIEKLDNHFANIKRTYSFADIKKIANEKLNKVLDGDTLIKNNINKVLLEINLDAIDEIVHDIVRPSLEDLMKLTPEQINILNNKVFVTNTELDNLSKALDIKDDTGFDEFQDQLGEQLQTKYTDVANDVLDKTVDASQKADVTSAEPIEEAHDMRDIFLEHALPSTPFSTTGISVLYDKNGRDHIDDEGLPVLNDNEYQKLWFETIDKLNETITDYTLTPVRATYDESDDVQQTLAKNFPDESRRTNNDIFVFLTDKNGNKVKVNDTYVFTSVRKVDEVYPDNKKPRVAPDYILNEYLHSIGIYSTFSYDDIRNQKIDTFVQAPDARAKLKDLIANGNTGEDLFTLAIAHGKKEYQKFLDELLSNTDNTKKLKIEDTTKGYPLYQVDEKGNKIRHHVLDVFNQVKLVEGKHGKDQLQGAKLGLVANTQLKIRNKFVKLPEGSVYLQFDNDDFIVLQPRKLNETEIDTVLYLLSLADSNKPLNTITVDSPDGYTLNGKKIGKKLPVFFKKSQTGEQSFSLLETMINYGLRQAGKNKKGEIFIQSGEVVFTDFDGVLHKVPLNDVTEYLNTGKGADELVYFLQQKNFNVNNTMLANNPTFQYPIFNKGKLEFKTNESYYQFMLTEVLTTSALQKEGYPTRLQRNVVYSPKLESTNQVVTKEVAAKPVTITPAKTETLDEIIKKQVIGYGNAIKQEGGNPTRQEVFDKLKRNTKLNERFTNAGYEFNDNIINEIVDGILGKEETSKPTEPTLEKKLTPAERLAKLRGEKTVALGKTPTADKIVDVEQLLEKYIENKIVQKNCK
jgi:hypothetical protein